MSTRFRLSPLPLLVAAALLLGAVQVLGAQIRDPQPGPDYRWVNGHWVNYPAPRNTAWVEGHENSDGQWVPGHFVYVGPVPPGKAWVPGHWDGDEYVPGSFRESYRKNFEWSEGYYDCEGNWVFGYWKYVGPPKPGHEWVVGHWRKGAWVEGFWRPVHMKDRAWVPGHYAPGGRYVPGHWK